MESIFSYQNPVDLLCDSLKHRQARSPKFSLRAWSKKLGFPNHGLLQQILVAKRKIPKKYVGVFAKDLEMTAKEKRYFSLLVDLQSASESDHKFEIIESMQRLSKSSTPLFRELEVFEYLSDPLHTVILEMTELNDFRADVTWIQNALAWKVNKTCIKRALKRLESLSLIERRGSEYFILHEHMSNVIDVPKDGTKNYHKQVLGLAAQAIDAQDLLDREFNSFSMNIDSSRIPKAKELIRGFVKTFINEIESNEKDQSDAVYQLNMQFFGLASTKRERVNGKNQSN